MPPARSDWPVPPLTTKCAGTYNRDVPWLRYTTLSLVVVSFLVLVAVATLRLHPRGLPADTDAADLAPGGEEEERNPSPDVAATLEIAEATREDELVAAAFSGDAGRVRRLLNQGIAPDARNDSGHGALHRAAESASLDVIRVLLDAGADPDLPDANGFTPLMAATFAGATSSVALLIEVGADVNAQFEPHMVTALEQVFAGWMESRGVKGTPLDSDRRNIAKALFVAGADPNVGGPFGSPVRFLWELRRDEEMVRLFFDHEARLDDAPHVWPLERLPGPVGEMIREGVRALHDHKPQF